MNHINIYLIHPVVEEFLGEKSCMDFNRASLCMDLDGSALALPTGDTLHQAQI